MKGETPAPADLDSSQYVHLGRVSKFALDCRNESDDVTTDQRYTANWGQDWALIILDNPPVRLNSFRLPGDKVPHVIDEYVPAHEKVAGQVYVLCGSGPKKGTIFSHSVPIQLGVSSFDVQQITLEDGIGTLNSQAFNMKKIIEANLFHSIQ